MKILTAYFWVVTGANRLAYKWMLLKITFYNGLISKVNRCQNINLAKMYDFSL